jgi:uncharacterized protein
MRKVFVDAAYWVALLNPQDSLHRRCITLSESLGQCEFITTEMVLTEVLNFFAKRGTGPRRACADFVRQLRDDANTGITPQTSAQFDDALQLYSERRDKSWSRTDCASFRVMANEGITEALTFDRHFEQAGFKALLRSSR